MKHAKFATALALTAAVVLIISCTKTGPTGPAGAQGATGAAGSVGAAGAQGNPGAKGDTGVANVQYSEWVDVVWHKSTSTPGAAFSDAIAASAITNQILDSGIVLVYLRYDSSTNTPNILPYTFGQNPSTSFTFQFSLEVGSLSILSSAPITGSLGAADIDPNAQIRYVIVPPGVAIGSDYTYEKIAAKFKIVN
jgi:hypothetical protein